MAPSGPAEAKLRDSVRRLRELEGPDLSWPAGAGARSPRWREAGPPSARERGPSDPIPFRGELARLAARAATRRPEKASIRIGAACWQKLAAAGVILGLGGAALVAPRAALAAAQAGLAVIVLANAAVWTAALLARRAPEGAPPPILPALPKITLLVPLYREGPTLPLLIRALARLRYPRRRLEAFLVLEADDEETRAALDDLPLPSFVRVLEVPDGSPRTKPRALNFALDFASGDLIGVYDAEDRPPPDQLARIAAQFAQEPPDVACVQARLGYYNRGENLVTRFFELEYAAWFDVMLPGLRRLGAPVPLGGTSLFVRRNVLDRLGGWDSHNVTEDADLGMAIARAGWRTALSSSLTEEEAASRPGAWIRQRSRWLKGYLATWITHMRRPGALWRDLGGRGFLALNLVLLAPVLGYLSLPALWAIAAAELVRGGTLGAASEVLRGAGLLCALAIGAAAALGAHGRGWRRGLPLIPLTPLYWPLGAAAAWLAAYELARRPFQWRKTRHGVGRVAETLRREAAETLKRGAE